MMQNAQQGVHCLVQVSRDVPQMVGACLPMLGDHEIVWRRRFSPNHLHIDSHHRGKRRDALQLVRAEHCQCVQMHACAQMLHRGGVPIATKPNGTDKHTVLHQALERSFREERVIPSWDFTRSRLASGRGHYPNKLRGLTKGCFDDGCFPAL